MAKIDVHLPDTLAEYQYDLRLFFDLMVFKLNVNRHKNGEGHPIEMYNLMMGETKELLNALLHENQTEVSFEATDVANLAFLCHQYSSRMTKADFEKGRIMEEPDNATA